MRRPGAPPRPPPAPDPAWAYFFDLDGTLLDIAPSPAGARLDPAVRRRLAVLHRLTGGALALISGRAIEDIDHLVLPIELPVAGQHGLERRDAVGRVHRHVFATARFEQEYRHLAAVVARHPGLLLEHKGLSLALHYRGRPRLAGFAHRLVREVRAHVGPAYCVLAGKRVVELKPAGRDKGVAVREFMQEAPFQGRLPVFLGDDVTDEYGFRMVNRLHGHSIKVGPGPTAARWRLRDVEAVREWLELP